MASLNHIGIAISHLPRIIHLFELLGLKLDHSEDVPEQGVRTHFIPLPQGSASNSATIELLEATDPEGTVAQILKKRGPGIHHLAFNMDPGYIERVSEKLRAEGYRLIYPEPKRGAHGAKINFIHPSTAEGLLIELMEGAK
jgi:methylmalonyl-CoA/ethylmalonyl-CoA epimerase